MNSGDNEEQPSLSRDFIMSEESSKHENILNDDVWLIMGNDPIKSSEGDRFWMVPGTSSYGVIYKETR